MGGELPNRVNYLVRPILEKVQFSEDFQFSGPQFIYRVMHSFKYGATAPTLPSKCLLGLFLLFFCHFFGDRHAVYLNSNRRHYRGPLNWKLPQFSNDYYN